MRVEGGAWRAIRVGVGVVSRGGRGGGHVIGVWLGRQVSMRG